jgi:hypothetical protein
MAEIYHHLSEWKQRHEERKKDPMVRVSEFIDRQYIPDHTDLEGITPNTLRNGVLDALCGRLRSTPAGLVGYIEAPDAEQAIEEAISAFGSPTPSNRSSWRRICEHQSWP